jgi:hypothetical protein
MAFWLPTANGTRTGEKLMRRSALRIGIMAVVCVCASAPAVARAAAIYFVDYTFESDPFGGGRDRFSLHRANLDGSGRDEIVHDMGPQPQYASMAVFDGRVYWRDFFDVVRAATTDGVVVSPAEAPNAEVGAALFDRAIDAAGVHTYFTGRDAETGGLSGIFRGDFEYENPTMLVPTRGFKPNLSIALDEAGGKIYWAGAWGGGATGLVQRANLADGSAVQTLLEGFTEDDFPLDLALDPAGGKLYVANDSLHKIQRANLDGSGLEDIVTDVTPFAVAIEQTVPEPAVSVRWLGLLITIRRARRGPPSGSE